MIKLIFAIISIIILILFIVYSVIPSSSVDVGVGSGVVSVASSGGDISIPPGPVASSGVDAVVGSGVDAVVGSGVDVSSIAGRTNNT
jgi:hypothetical protein